MFYINQIVKILSDTHDVEFPNYGIVHSKDEGYRVRVTFKRRVRGSYRWIIKRSRIIESDRSDL